MRITSGGNVGINNGAPLSPLSFAPTNEPKISFYDGGNTTDHYGIGLSSNQLNYHVMPGAIHAFYTGGKNGDGTELMRIQSNGRVGIGTQNPSSKLAVNEGSINVLNTATISSPAIEVINDGGGSGHNDDIRIKSYGNSTAPALNMFSAHGTAAAPLNSESGDVLAAFKAFGQVNGSQDNLATIRMLYLGNGTTRTTRMDFNTDGGAATSDMTIDGSGNVGIGTPAPTARLSVNGNANNTTGTWGIFSDARVKTIDSDYKDGLNTIMKIHPVKFHYNANAPFKSNEQQIGIIAQEMEQIAPYMVTKIKADGFDDLRQYNNQALPYMLVNAIQEQQKQIEALKAENQKLKTNEVELKENKAVTAQLMERVKQMEQMMGVKEIEGTSKIAGK
jgi:hypothetical protein